MGLFPVSSSKGGYFKDEKSMIAFVYKKGTEIVFKAFCDESDMIHEDMINSGYEHISTINTVIYLNQISTVLYSRIDVTKKVKLIKEIIESK